MKVDSASCHHAAGMTITTLDFAAQKADSSTRRSLSDLSLSVAKCKKIVVVTGAGISCSSGIPVRAFLLS
jgi:NAD-dependent histone deacetylase SIR2